MFCSSVVSSVCISTRKMTTRKHLLVLLMTVLSSVNTEEDVYCEVEESRYPYFSLSSVICRNTSFHENQTITPKVYSSNIIEKVQLISVTGDVHNTMLQYLPTADDLIIFDSNIKSFSLQSDIESLNVSNSIFPKVSSDLLKGCKKLKRVTFMSNQGLLFDEGAFKHLKTLMQLVIMNQTLPKIQRHVFEGLENLSILQLALNNIQEIDEDAFLDLPNLNHLFLDVNPIESFNVNISGLTRLNRLSLINTNLKRVNFGVLGAIKTLTSIGLSGQLLKNTNATELVIKVPNLRLVGIPYEELQCPKVISFVDELKKKKVAVMPVDMKTILRHKDFTKPSMC